VGGSISAVPGGLGSCHALIAHSSPTTRVWNRLLKAGLPVALVYWDGGTLDASLDAALHSVARDDAGRLLIARLKPLARNPQAAALSPAPLPALIAYRDGEPVTRAAAITASDFRAHVNYLLGRGPLPAARETPSSNALPPKPVIVTDASFQRDVLQSDLPVLVDLWAPLVRPLPHDRAHRREYRA